MLQMNVCMNLEVGRYLVLADALLLKHLQQGEHFLRRGQRLLLTRRRLCWCHLYYDKLSRRQVPQLCA